MPDTDLRELIVPIKELKDSLLQSIAITEQLQRELAEMHQEVAELREQVELEEGGD